MGMTGRWILGILAIATAYWGVRYLRTSDMFYSPPAPPTQSQIREAERKFEEQLNVMMQRAKTSDGIDQEKLNLEVQKKQQELIDSASSTEGKRQRTAADLVHGYKFRHTVLYKEYCLAQGVDVTPFVAEFNRTNRVALAKLDAIDRKYPIDRGPIMAVVRRQLEPLLDAEMRQAAKDGGGTIRQVCEWIRDNAEDFANELEMSKALPAAYKVLAESTP